MERRFSRKIMPTLIAQPTRVQAAGSKPKIIEELVGRVNSNTEALSVAHMLSPEGWVEPGQTPEFDEYTVVLGVSRHGAGLIHEEIASIDFRRERA